jgi:hypothetical protein
VIPILFALLAGPDPAVWDFEAAEVTWKPRAATIALDRVEGRGATEASRAFLRVRGRIVEGWNYASSEARPLRAGQLYRLSAWVRLDRLGPTTPPPCLKCEFVGADSRSDLGRANTEPCDGTKTGQWQRIQGEFRAPEGTVRGWVALEKGGPEPMEIDAGLDDVRLDPIPALSQVEQYRLQPLPKALEARRGLRPRIYLEAKRAAVLREAIRGTHAPLWEELKVQADRAVKTGPPAYRNQPDSSGDEQLWQRGVGNTLPVLAMAHLLSGEAAYLEAARTWSLASCGYSTWGLGRTDGMDLAAGHQLLGLALVYDWCHAALDAEARRTIRDTLVRRTSAMFEAAASGRIWWSRSYLQNHLWVNIGGMAAAGLALFDEEKDAALWIGLPLDKFRRTMAALGDDGASHEGVGYWGYGVEYLLKFMHPARELLGVDLYDNPWWRRTALYRQYLALPRKAWTASNNIVDLADCPRGNWYGPEYLLRALAREYRDGRAQWLAAEIDGANVDSAEARWLNLVWYDPSVAPRPPDDLPTLHHFEDMGIVSARSGWSGDESLAVFKCGPFIGHKAVQEFAYDPGGGHVHPDANHFVLFGGGEWLVRDDGYRAKWTGQHNTLLVDGKGQLGEGRMWFDGTAALKLKARPRVLRAVSRPGLDHVAGDAVEAYPRERGLKRFTRHLLFLKPDVLVVADDIALEAPRTMELRFHPEPGKAERDGAAFVLRGKKAVLRIEPLTMEGALAAAEDVAAADRHGGKGESLFTVRLTRTAAAWRNAVALSWAQDRVALEARGDVWTFRAGARAAVLDWESGEAVTGP